MLSWIREKFGPVIVGSIVGLIALVFIFEGVFRQSKVQGNHEGAVAGTVNGEVISRAEFSRAVTQRIEFFKQISGGKFTEDQLKAFNVRGGVFDGLVQQKLMTQSARDGGWAASDAEVRDRIMEIDVFQKDGHFDAETYRGLLAANRLSPEAYEKMVRDDLSTRRMTDFFRERVLVSEEELKQEFLVAREKRDIKYVLLTAEAAKKVNAKATPEETKKTIDTLAGQVAQKLTTVASADAAVNALLKPYGVEVKKTGLVARGTAFIPGLGDSKDLLTHAFSPQGTQTQTFQMPAGTVIAVVTGSEKADLSKLAAERSALLGQLATRKEQALQEAWLKKAKDHAKIEQNKEVVMGDEGA